MRILTIAALAAATCATPAFAQDADSFTGPSISVFTGMEQVNTDGPDETGIIYGVTAGYDVDLGKAVVGIELEAAESNTDYCETAVLVASDSLCTKASRDLYAGARAGIKVGGSSLAYVKGGYTNARVDVDYVGGAAAPGADFSDHENLDGFRVGAGAEHRLASGVTVKVEYRYSDYEQDVSRHQGLIGVGFRF
ncbi:MULTISPECIES: outer membrane protein [unclassified Sphingomonas]|uniref:outer membrane protein n=1 Tax=unclassified Sphingomonas TaxID=196159 RepID=UPI002150B624|nr:MULTISPECIES: porin family protein [unclassified Sphingomonas]MCR5871859.1 porin family protein [Sphingomonas sp. J344]UUX99856.1 porin family protein [Sphingomonas sp. J315]